MTATGRRVVRIEHDLAVGVFGLGRGGQTCGYRKPYPKLTCPFYEAGHDGVSEQRILSAGWGEPSGGINENVLAHRNAAEPVKTLELYPPTRNLPFFYYVAHRRFDPASSQAAPKQRVVTKRVPFGERNSILMAPRGGGAGQGLCGTSPG